jgi:hypothetical protein
MIFRARGNGNADDADAADFRGQKNLKLMEEQHRAGCARQPLTAEEFDIWQDEQVVVNVISSGRISYS